MKRLALAVVATAVALLAAEWLARLAGGEGGLGQVTPLHGLQTRTAGGVELWDVAAPRATVEDLRAAAADRDAFTILGLGDSIMYGVELAAPQTYLEQARAHLAARTARPLRVLNLAVPGYNTVQEDARYRELGDELRPDLVLVHYWDNDAWQFRFIDGHAVDFADVMPDGSVRTALPLPQGLSDWLLLRSRLYARLTQARLRRSDAFDWTRVTEPLAAIDARARAQGARLVVLVSPRLAGPAVQPGADLAQLRAFAAPRGIEVIDLSEWLGNAAAAQVALDPAHLNAEGHRLIGARLADYLLANDLAPCTPRPPRAP